MRARPRREIVRHQNRAGTVRLIALLLALLLGSCESTPFYAAGPQAEYPLLMPDYTEAPNDVAVIYLNTPIEYEHSVVFEVLMETAQLGHEHIVVNVDSYGGSLRSAQAIGSAILESRVPVTCVVENLAASAAFIVLQSCPRRVISPNARLLIHEARYRYPHGPMSIHEQASRMFEQHELNQALAKLQCFRMNISVDECHDRYWGRDWVLSPTEALELRAVDRIAVLHTIVEELRYGALTP